MPSQSEPTSQGFSDQSDSEQQPAKPNVIEHSVIEHGNRARKAHERRGLDRRIAALAVPALGALIAEPMFLIVDSAMIGHLGAAPLAGLAIAGTILQTAVGLMVFLAYATTPAVARRRGAGDLRGAVQAGTDGIWLAAALGVAVAAIVWAISPWAVSQFGADSATHADALSYLTISCAGLPAMLIVFAATGLLRGLQDTRTPLYVAGIGFTANALLNWWFIYGFGFGVAGSALGTVVAQWGMVAVFIIVVTRHARRNGASWRPRRDGISGAGSQGAWLFLRTVGLRVALVATVFAASQHGTTVTAGYQIIFTLFTTVAFALDALAIAAQALIGDALGARNSERAKAVLRRVLFWGVLSGVLLGSIIAACSLLLGRIFTTDPEVLEILPGALLVLGVSLPLCGLVFVLDGVLMGAGDAKYLAWGSLINVAVYLPALWLLTSLSTATTAADPTAIANQSIVWLTASFTLVFMATRALTLGLRARTNAWVVLGV